MTESLLVRRPTGIGLDSNEEPALEVCKGVQVEEEVVHLILRDNVVRLHLSLVVLGSTKDC